MGEGYQDRPISAYSQVPIFFFSRCRLVFLSFYKDLVQKALFSASMSSYP